MTDGLITRIGKWMDQKWETKATEAQVEAVRWLVQERWNNLENAQIKDKIELQEQIKGLQRAIHDIDAFIKTPSDSAKEVADLKTRMEKIELYAGMTRKVDPTKPPVVKSAFAM